MRASAGRTYDTRSSRRRSVRAQASSPASDPATTGRRRVRGRLLAVTDALDEALAAVDTWGVPNVAAAVSSTSEGRRTHGDVERRFRVASRRQGRRRLRLDDRRRGGRGRARRPRRPARLDPAAPARPRLRLRLRERRRGRRGAGDPQDLLEPGDRGGGRPPRARHRHAVRGLPHRGRARPARHGRHRPARLALVLACTARSPTSPGSPPSCGADAARPPQTCRAHAQRARSRASPACFPASAASTRSTGG